MGRRILCSICLNALLCLFTSGPGLAEITKKKTTCYTYDHEAGTHTKNVPWQIPVSAGYPQGLKYRTWFSENGTIVFGFDNHKAKGPHLHIGEVKVGYVFLGIDELKRDVVAMIKKEGFIYEE